jgi:acetyl-CoA carboxylase biotin carboxyl carrier protein
MLRFDEVAELLRIIDGSCCEELILETADIKLVVRRRGAASETPHFAPPSSSTGMASPVAPPQAAAAHPHSIESRTKLPSSGLIETKAPMVGTFYIAASPGAAPFAEVGSFVAKGDKLCMIEVMKLFTTVFAEQDGRVVEVCARDGELVEYGQTLFLQEPT